MLKIKVWVSTNRVGSKCEDEIEVYLDGEETAEQIEQAKEDAAREWVFNNLDWGFSDPE